MQTMFCTLPLFTSAFTSWLTGAFDFKFQNVGFHFNVQCMAGDADGAHMYVLLLFITVSMCLLFNR